MNAATAKAVRAGSGSTERIICTSSSVYAYVSCGSAALGLTAVRADKRYAQGFHRQIHDPSKKTWKHGDEERKAYLAAFSEKDPKQRAALVELFASQYADSDYLDSLLLLKMGAESEMKDARAQIRTANRLLASPSTDPRAMLAAYSAIADLQPALIQPSEDSQIPSRLDELKRTVLCGEQSLATTSGAPGVDKIQNAAEYSFAKASGYVAYHRGQFDTAKAELQKAIGLKP
jgi:hypothetical protein